MLTFRLLFALYLFVAGGLLVVVKPLIVIPVATRRPVPTPTVGSGSRRLHHLGTNDLSAKTCKRHLPVTLRKQPNPNVSLLRMSLILPKKIDNSMMSKTTGTTTTRRNWIDSIKTGIVLLTTQQLLLHSQVASAKPDCYTDCYKNCIALAPKDNVYCSESCTDYCLQDDREDGLSGSISSEKGEVGILGGSFGTGTVVKGQDKPPVLGKIPGLDFTSESGKKMIGY